MPPLINLPSQSKQLTQWPGAKGRNIVGVSLESLQLVLGSSDFCLIHGRVAYARGCRVGTREKNVQKDKKCHFLTFLPVYVLKLYLHVPALVYLI